MHRSLLRWVFGALVIFFCAVVPFVGRAHALVSAQTTGGYVAGIGEKEDFADLSLRSLFGAGPVPWGLVIGYVVLLAGFIIGLGAVTVIDVHGLMAIRSSYWTQTTIRAHKITKPLIWAGMTLALIGGTLAFRAIGFSGLVSVLAVIAAVLILNGCFLSFVVSPELLRREKEGRDRELLPWSLQWKIALSFVVSFGGWWTALFLVVWQMLFLS